MNKINLVLHPKEYTSFKITYLRPLFNLYFNITIFDESVNYPNKTLFVTGQSFDKTWARILHKSGHKVIVDNLWDIEKVTTDFYTLYNKNWYWYNESLWYQSLGYNTYAPNRNYSKLAFMPINRKKSYRDLLVNKLSSRLNQFIYSYNSELEGDNKTGVNWQRYFNPNWYDSTYFSLVVETKVRASVAGTVFISEKTYKPIALQHPFLVYGPPNILTSLRDNGFVTYENLFDESYDQLTDIDAKVTAMLDNVDNFKQVSYDSLTLDKIQHNYNHFFNKSLIVNKIKQEIIDPLIEYAET